MIIVLCSSSIIGAGPKYNQEHIMKVEKALSVYQVDNAQYRNRLTHAILDASFESDIDPMIIVAIIKHESNFDYSAKGKDGEIGLMQILPNWAKEYNIKKAQLWNVETNIRYGAKIIKRQLNRYENDNYRLWKALRAYNSCNSKGSRYATEVQNKFNFLKTIG